MTTLVLHIRSYIGFRCLNKIVIRPKRQQLNARSFNTFLTNISFLLSARPFWVTHLILAHFPPSVIPNINSHNRQYKTYTTVIVKNATQKSTTAFSNGIFVNIFSGIMSKKMLVKIESPMSDDIFNLVITTAIKTTAGIIIIR